jgi:hypothetical protein
MSVTLQVSELRERGCTSDDSTLEYVLFDTQTLVFDADEDEATDESFRCLWLELDLCPSCKFYCDDDWEQAGSGEFLTLKKDRPDLRLNRKHVEAGVRDVLAGVCCRTIVP